MNEISGQTSIVIHAPAAELYSYLLDFTRHPEWVKNVQKVTQEGSDSVQVGTTFQTQEGPPPVALGPRLAMMFHFVRGLISGAKGYSRAEITGLEPNRRIAWKAGVPKGEGYFNVAQWEFLLEAQNESTHLTQRFVYQPQNEISRRMIGAAGAKGIEAACLVSLRQLKERMEARQPVGSLSRKTA